MIRFAACAVLLTSAALVIGCGGSDTPECAPGQFYDANMQMCVTGGAPPQCPAGQVWNGSQCAPGGSQCPAGQVFNGSACVAQGGAPQCPAGQSWDGAQCVPAAGPGPAAGGACTVQNIGGGGGVVADQAIKALAAQHIPAGAQAVGGAVVGNFQAGQCMDTVINVNAGKCYTVVGASIGTVGDLDVELIPQLPIPIPGVPEQVIAQDQTDGPTAVLGGKPNCWTAPIPGTMKMRVRVASGQGMAGAQLYEK